MSKIKKVLISLVLVVVITSSFIIPASALYSGSSEVIPFFQTVGFTSDDLNKTDYLVDPVGNYFNVYASTTPHLSSGVTYNIDYIFTLNQDYWSKDLYYDITFNFENIDTAKYYAFSKWYFVFSDGSKSTPAVFNKISGSTTQLRFNGLSSDYPMKLKQIVFDMRYTTTKDTSNIGIRFINSHLRLYDEARKNTEDIMSNQDENTDRIISNQTEIANDFKNGWSAGDKTADDTTLKEEEQLQEDILNSETKILIGYGANGEPIYSEGTFQDIGTNALNGVLNFAQNFLQSPLGLMSSTAFLTNLMNQSELQIIFYFSLLVGLIPFLVGLSFTPFRRSGRSGSTKGNRGKK